MDMTRGPDGGADFLQYSQQSPPQQQEDAPLHPQQQQALRFDDLPSATVSAYGSRDPLASPLNDRSVRSEALPQRRVEREQ